METYNIIQLDNMIMDEVAALYARVFAGPPWYEIKKCSKCNETYGAGSDLQLFRNGKPCRRCGERLRLIDYWLGGPAHDVYKNAISQKNFVGVGARLATGELIGFSWGYAVPLENTPSVWFKEVNVLLQKQGIKPDLTFYAAETGVEPKFQKQGIGTALMYNRFQAAAKAGFTAICGRTINPKLVERYEFFFGAENVDPIFKDPDPVKADRTWYYCPLDLLRPDLYKETQQPHPRKLDPVIEEAVIQIAFDQPSLGQLRASNELKKQGKYVTPSGVRSIWRRHNLENFQKRIQSLEAKVSESGNTFTDVQLHAIERARKAK